jgi:hypothetical protein
LEPEELGGVEEPEESPLLLPDDELSFGLLELLEGCIPAVDDEGSEEVEAADEAELVSPPVLLESLGLAASTELGVNINNNNAPLRIETLVINILNLCFIKLPLAPSDATCEMTYK